MPARPDVVEAASRPPRRSPDQAASSFTRPLRRSGGGALPSPHEYTAPRGAPRSWCQSAELRASREHSRPSTIPARPSDTSATRCWNPSRSAAEAPEWPWSMSMTVMVRRPAQRSSPCPAGRTGGSADSVLWRTCLRLDWRSRGRPAGRGGRRLPSTPRYRGASGLLQRECRLRGRAGSGGPGEHQGRQHVDELGGHRGREIGGLGGVHAGLAGRRRRAGAGVRRRGPGWPGPAARR